MNVAMIALLLGVSLGSLVSNLSRVALSAEAPAIQLPFAPMIPRSIARASTHLSNRFLRVDFGDRGLISVAGLVNGRTYRLADDGFLITIDGQRVDSRTLPIPRRRVVAGTVTYVWSAAGHSIEVSYELRPGWAFVSKQLLVRGAAGRTIRIGTITPFRATLGELAASHFEPGRRRADLETGDYGTALRFADGGSLLVVAQNPFLHTEVSGTSVDISYPAEMSWRASDGAFPVDRVLIAPVQRSGRVLPTSMRPEWRMRDTVVAPGMDEAEVDAFTSMVRAFLVYQPAEPANVFVGWTANDYQIDAGTPEGRAEYKRVIDRAAELGAKHVLYAPANSALSRRKESADYWSWEYVLWLGLGERLRRNEWNPAAGEIPPSVSEMVNYAGAKGVRLLAYVYPVLGFTQDTSWLVAPEPGDPNRFSDLGVRTLQDWLIETLVTFHRRTGIGGYAFDHTFLGYPKTSRYAQWFGWRRVMEELRRRVPDIVIDGRQAYHLYGPWSWLAGNYPHPTANDEQPESFAPFPDLHFDRVSANRERYTAYRYRNYEFAPSEIVPGYMTHQTSRSDDRGEMPEAVVGNDTLPIRFRARDWDYLGWRYSVLSSIAVAGWNNVLDMIPARDSAEQANFRADDIRWWRGWIDWTGAHRELLRRTRTILGEPRLGAIDGTAAVMGDSGYIFLFNPNGRRLTARVALDGSIGLTSGRRLALREVYPREGRLIGQARRGYWERGDTLAVTLDGGSAMVVQLLAAPAVSAPVLFGAPGEARLERGQLRLTGVTGEVGMSEELTVALRSDEPVRELLVNETVVPFAQVAPEVISARVRYAGEPFGRYEPVIAYDSLNEGGHVSGTLTVPKRIFDQLQARQAAWPIPWTSEDYRNTFLAPERLLLYVQIAEPDDRWEARLRINGRPVELRKAYSAIRAARRTFVGFYADLSLLEADRPYAIDLDLPVLRRGQLQGVYMENVESEFTAVLGR